MSVSAATVEKLCKDMKTVSIMSFIVGGLMVLSCVYIPVAIPMIIGGLKAKEGADNFLRYSRTNDQDTYAVAFERLSEYFNMTKWWMMITLALALLITVAYIGIFGWAIMSGGFENMGG